MNVIRKTFQYGKHEVTLETGRIARQATGAVLVTMGNTSVLVAVTGRRDMKPGQDFFPLSVHYQEKTYAAGKIPGGFFKREGRPSEKETLTSRLIDRPIRPLFPKGFMNEVQVVATVMSADRDMDPDIAAMIGTSAALMVSGIPFQGPIGGARVGYRDGCYILNPGYDELRESLLDMVVAGTDDAVLMVESEAKELSEDQMLGAVLYGHQEMQVVINAIKEFAAEGAKPAWEIPAGPDYSELASKLEQGFGAQIGDAYRIIDKMERRDRLDELRSAAIEQLAGEDIEADIVAGQFGAMEKRIVRERVLSGEPRIDGRDTKTVRNLSIEVGVLPKTHGSALFTRGETQALVTATLGTARDAQIIDALEGERKDHLMLHYNFPPFCVGETGFIGSPKRREIGHGRLARRGIQAVIPTEEEFPYTLRVVSEITESNGSSSMASVCGSSLALMDAGVPISAPVAGIAMGLVKEGDRFAVLTDILGDEDHLGDMDFKVAGTDAGVTALQMDIKIAGITEEIMEIALNQAGEARAQILEQMCAVIAEPRAEVSGNAPAMETMRIPVDKIRDVIGKGGAVIRAICEETGASIDIEDDGQVRIYADTREGLEEAKSQIDAITAEAEVGRVYRGRVVRIVDFGAFVNILPGKDGLVHISQIKNERVERVNDHLEEGQEINVLVLDIDNRGRIKLTMKDVDQNASAEVVAETTV